MMKSTILVSIIDDPTATCGSGGPRWHLNGLNSNNMRVGFVIWIQMSTPKVNKFHWFDKWFRGITGTNRISWQDFPRLTYRCLFRFATRSIKFFITKRDILWYANFYENSPLWSHLSTISTQGILERKMPIWIVPAWNSSEKDEADTRRNMVHVTLLSRLCRGRIAILCNTAQCPQGPQQ